MAGTTQLTAADDIWSFSICCVEILSMGRVPWPLMDDSTVRHIVLRKSWHICRSSTDANPNSDDNTRPPTPRNSRFNTPGLQDILRACWNSNPNDRPPFYRVARDLKLLRKAFGHGVLDSPMLPAIPDVTETPKSPSPDMRPQKALPNFIQRMDEPHRKRSSH